MSPRLGRSLVATLLGVAVASRGAAVRAQTAGDGGAEESSHDGLTLVWDAPAGCPGRDEVRAAIARAVAAAPTPGSSAAAIEARATVAQGARGWTLTLRTLRGDARGERVMQAESCIALADAATLVVALMLNPNAVPAPIASAPPDHTPPPPRVETVVDPVRVEATPPRPSRPPAHPRPPPRPRATPRPSPATRPAPRVAHARFGLDALADLGTFAAPAWGLGVRGGFTLAGFSAFLAAALYPSQHTAAATMPAFGGDFVFGHGAAWGCYGRRFGPVEPGLCAGLELGALHAAGTGVTNPASRWRFEAAQVDQVTATVWLARAFGLHFALGIAVPFTRANFELDGIGALYTQSPVAARGSAGVELSF